MPIIPISGSAVARGSLVPLGSYVADGTSVSPSFTNIPQGYQDLMLVSSVRSSNTSGAPQSLYILPNSDSSNNKSVTTLFGNSSSMVSARYSGAAFMYNASVTTQSSAQFNYSTQITHILSYANASVNKTIFTRWSCDLTGSGLVGMNIVRYPYNTPITSITAVVDGVVAYVKGSTFTLYGVRSVGQ
jgi:hypothetical protein